MITCKKCHEFIGENVKECPFCRSVITEEDRRTAIAENERVHLDAVQNSMEEYAKRKKLEYIIYVAMIAAVIIEIALVVLLDMDSIWIFIISALILAIYLVCVYKFRIGFCPYCESYMGRRMMFNTHCPRCGGRLK